MLLLVSIIGEAADKRVAIGVVLALMVELMTGRAIRAVTREIVVEQRRRGRRGQTAEARLVR